MLRIRKETKMQERDLQSFAKKLRDRRAELGWSQEELAERSGIGRRSLVEYEKGKRFPRAVQLARLGEALGTGVEYLRNPSLTLAEAAGKESGIPREPYEGEEVYIRREVEELLKQNRALFAGGDLKQEAKDAFFEAIMRAYLACKGEAVRRQKGEDHDKL